MNKTAIAGILILLLVVAGGFFISSNNQSVDSKDESKEMVKNEGAMMDNKDEDASVNAKTIVDVAVEAGSFETLVTAVKEADLVETLSGEGPFTVFAPTDEAFEKLPEGTLEAVLADKEKLTSILTYHVVPGKVMSGDLSDGMTAETVQGQSLTFSVSDSGVKVNEATVSTADVSASNGVIHIIDSVMLPE